MRRENKMNIMIIAHERNLGGASKSLVTLASEMQRKGHKVMVVVPFKSGQVYRKLLELGIPTKKIFFGWWMMPEYWNAFMKFAFRILYALEWIPQKKIEKIVKQENIQIIHSNSSVIDIGARVSLERGIPHVWHFREYGKDDYRLEFLKGRENSIAYVNNSGSQIVFISKDLRKYYSDICDEHCQVIYNGIPKEYLNEKKYQIYGKQKVIFLIAGNMQRTKGHMTALKAAKFLLEEGISGFELWIAGGVAATQDSREYAKEIKLFADDNLGEHCKILGRVSDMKKLREKADVELVCSNREAFGRVTVEAMMAGNPVIGADSGANTELIQDKKNGRIYKNGDAFDLSGKMQWFIEKEEHIEECGKNAFSCSKEQFISNINTERIELLYGKMLNEYSAQ